MPENAPGMLEVGLGGALASIGGGIVTHRAGEPVG
jgi:hypothetical protein